MRSFFILNFAFSMMAERPFARSHYCLKPAAGNSENIPSEPSARFVFDFATTDATLLKDGDNLVINFPDGSQVSLQDFYSEYDEENLPSFVMDDNERRGWAAGANWREGPRGCPGHIQHSRHLARAFCRHPCGLGKGPESPQIKQSFFSKFA